MRPRGLTSEFPTDPRLPSVWLQRHLRFHRRLHHVVEETGKQLRREGGTDLQPFDAPEEFVTLDQPRLEVLRVRRGIVEIEGKAVCIRHIASVEI